MSGSIGKVRLKKRGSARVVDWDCSTTVICDRGTLEEELARKKETNANDGGLGMGFDLWRGGDACKGVVEEDAERLNTFAGIKHIL